MFPRVSTFKRGDKVYKNLRIVESYRDEGKVRQRTVANLGSLDSFTEADVDSIINGLCRIFDRPQPDETPGVESALSYGHVHAVLALWKELKLAQVIAKHSKRSRIKFDLVAHLQVMLTNRLCDPKSKLELLAWLEGVFIPGIDREQIQYHHLLRAMDWLIAHKEDLEKELCNQVLTLFDQKLDLVFYDLTSSYFETELTDELRKYGYSRDHRSDKPQVTIGLVTTRDGIPVSHHVFPGNTTDKATVQRVIRDLRLRFPLDRAVFVGDRGMLTRDNLEVIKAEGLDYIVALNQRRDKDVESFLVGFQYEVDDARPGWDAERKRYHATGELPEGCETEDQMLDQQRLFAEEVVNGRRLVFEHCESVSKISAQQRHKRLQRTEDGVTLVIGKLEEQDAGEPHQDPGPDGGSGRPAAGPQPVHEHHPQGHRGHHEGGGPGLYPLLGPGHAAVPHHEHQGAHHPRGPPLGSRGSGEPGGPAPDVEDGAGHHEPGAGHEERRQRLHREPDGQVGGAPDQVDGGQAQRHLGPGGRHEARADSQASIARFRSVPHRYPPASPTFRITRWHGISHATRFRATAPATARTARGRPSPSATSLYAAT